MKLNYPVIFPNVQANETSTAPVATPRKRTTETLANIKTIGNNNMMTVVEFNTVELDFKNHQDKN